MEYEWQDQDLSDSELVRRLIQRGWGESSARLMVRVRDTVPGAAAIQEALYGDD